MRGIVAAVFSSLGRKILPITLLPFKDD